MRQSLTVLPARPVPSSTSELASLLGAIAQEKRLMLVFVLTFVVMLAFQPLLKKYMPQPATPAQQNQATQTQPAASTTAAATVAPAVSTPAAGVTKQAASETETVIENDLYRITFTNRGAQVKSWILKKFDNDAQSGPLDLVNSAAGEKYGYPLSLWTYDEGIRNKLSSVLYVPSREGKQTSPTTITFEYADQDVAVRKTFGFDNSYVVNVRASDGTLADDQAITVQITDADESQFTVHWTASIDLGSHPAGWVPTGIGDFNGDAASDLAWYNSATGDIDIWKLADGQFAGSSDIGPHPAGYQPVGFGDYSHDSASDVQGYPGVTSYRSRKHETFIANNGAFEIRNVDTGATEIAKPGADGKGVW